jgi:hypothetical protein
MLGFDSLLSFRRRFRCFHSKAKESGTISRRGRLDVAVSKPLESQGSAGKYVGYFAPPNTPRQLVWISIAKNCMRPANPIFFRPEECGQLLS